MKKIVSFLPFYNFHESYFYKDLGMIGYTFSQEKNFTSEVWALREGKKNDFVVKGQKWIGFKNRFQIYCELFKKAKDIDVLHIMHISVYTLLTVIIFRLKNTNGIIFLKMDSPLYETNPGVLIKDKRLKIRFIPFFIRNFLFKKINYFGFEDKELQQFYKDNYSNYADKFIFTTNGCYTGLNLKLNSQKENSVVLVGRFGSYQKNNEILFDMFNTFDCSFLNNRHFYLCGGTTDEFKSMLSSFKNKNNYVKNNVHYMGFLDREELFSLMGKCKIFLHTARFEGDPNVQYDSMYCGCFMISTDVANFKQNYHSKYGIFYTSGDVLGLYNALKLGVNITNNLKLDDYQAIQDYGIDNFSWKSSLKELLRHF